MGEHSGQFKTRNAEPSSGVSAPIGRVGHYPPTSQRLYSDIVQRWNGLSRAERIRLSAVCLAEGHDLSSCALSNHWCRRCCRFFEGT